MQPFKITVDTKEFCVTPWEEPDQILYEIKNGDNLVCVIGLNEEAEWEANNEYAEEQVKKIGAAIESQEV